MIAITHTDCRRIEGRREQLHISVLEAIAACIATAQLMAQIRETSLGV